MPLKFLKYCRLLNQGMNFHLQYYLLGMKKKLFLNKRLVLH